MKILLFANIQKRDFFEITCQVRDFLRTKKIELVARDEYAKELDIAPLSSVKPQEIDCVISLGGDGTILRFVHHFPEIEAPILAINLGHLGFMADVLLNDLYPSLEEFLRGEYRIEERMMIEGGMNAEKCFAVNEMVAHRAHNPTLVDLSIHVDGNYLNTFSADGIIIATPNGSTAYSLAAGGPILTPELQAFVLTPICPHTISNRPIVFMPQKGIEIHCLRASEPVEVSFDGTSRFSMKSGDIFRIQKSTRKFKLVHLLHTNHFTTLRTKLGWAGQVPYQEKQR